MCNKLFREFKGAILNYGNIYLNNNRLRGGLLAGITGGENAQQIIKVLKLRTSARREGK
jgi:hypothetical protein